MKLYIYEIWNMLVNNINSLKVTVRWVVGKLIIQSMDLIIVDQILNQKRK